MLLKLKFINVILSEGKIQYSWVNNNSFLELNLKNILSIKLIYSSYYLRR